jgi:hypothetical protein
MVMPSIGKVPTDPRQQLNSLQIIIANLDHGSPPLGSPAWQRVNEDSYVLAPPPVRRMAPASVDVNSGSPVEVAEAPRRSKAAVIWPHLRSVGEG